MLGQLKLRWPMTCAPTLSPKWLPEQWWRRWWRRRALGARGRATAAALLTRRCSATPTSSLSRPALQSAGAACAPASGVNKKGRDLSHVAGVPLAESVRGERGRQLFADVVLDRPALQRSSPLTEQSATSKFWSTSICCICHVWAALALPINILQCRCMLAIRPCAYLCGMAVTRR